MYINLCLWYLVYNNVCDKLNKKLITKKVRCVAFSYLLRHATQFL